MAHVADCSVESPYSTGELPVCHAPAISSKATLRPNTLSKLTIDDPQVLRGTNVCQVLSRCGVLLKAAGNDAIAGGASADTYKQSFPVDHIDTFLSHNWSTPRWQKFMALALHFNLYTATVGIVVTWVCLVFLESTTLLPSHGLEVRGVRMFELTQGEVYSCIAGPVVFLVLLLFGHDIKRAFGCSGGVLFFDKTCIHQTDPALKAKGIDGLAAFIHNSDTLLVVFSELYLKRLWTVYELASTLVIAPPRKLVVVPCKLAFLVFFGSAMWLIIVLIDAYLGPCVSCYKYLGPIFLRNTIVETLLSGTMMLCLCILLRSWAIQRAQIEHSLVDFRIRSTACKEESDRVLVQNNVAAFMRDFRLVEYFASQDEALDAFDALVQERIPSALNKGMGSTGIPYSVVVAMLVPAAMGLNIDYAARMMRYGHVWTAVWTFVDAVQWSFSWLPNITGLCYLGVSCGIDARGIPQAVLVVTTTVSMMLLMCAQDIFWAGMSLDGAVLHSYATASVYAVYVFFSAGLTLVLYWRPPLITSERTKLPDCSV